MSEPLGNLIDTLGCTHTPDDGEIVSDAMVILKVIDSEGRVSLRMSNSDGMSWIEQIGMLTAVQHMELTDLSEERP